MGFSASAPWHNRGLLVPLPSTPRTIQGTATILGENYPGGVVVQGALPHFAGIDTGLRQGAAKRFLDCERAVSGVEGNRHEHFFFSPLQQEAIGIGADHC
jgi:hypothetical protein